MPYHEFVNYKFHSLAYSNFKKFLSINSTKNPPIDKIVSHIEEIIIFVKSHGPNHKFITDQSTPNNI